MLLFENLPQRGATPALNHGPKQHCSGFWVYHPWNRESNHRDFRVLSAECANFLIDEAEQVILMIRSFDWICLKRQSVAREVRDHEADPRATEIDPDQLSKIGIRLEKRAWATSI